jgi:hypothetical protein
MAAKAFGDDPVAGPARVKVRTVGFDVVFVSPRAVGDCSVRELLLVFPCAIGDVEAGILALRDDVVGALSPSAPDGGTAGGAVSAGAGTLSSSWPASVLEALS